MAATTLEAVGEHLEHVSRLLKEQASRAEIGGSAAAEEELRAALLRSSAALEHEGWSDPDNPRGKSIRHNYNAAATLTNKTTDMIVHGGLQLDQELSTAARRSSTRITGQNTASSFSIRRSVQRPSGMEPDAQVETDVGEPRSSSRSKESVDSCGITESVMTRANAIFFDNARRRSATEIGCVRKVEWLIEHTYSECFFVGLIVLNVLFMVLEAQYQGARLGYNIGFYDSYGSDEHLQESHGPTPGFFVLAELVFAAMFTMELILRLIAMRWDFFHHPWMWLDAVVVILTDATAIGLPLFMSVSVVRAFRLVRLLRIVRLARRIQAFDSLYLMTTALGESVSILMWVCILLFVIQTLCALLLTNTIQLFYLTTDSYLTQAQQEEIFMFFGTYWRAMVSLFELMLANWPTICRMMMETLHESWSVVIVLYKLTMGFAVLGVICGVFTQETFRAAESDDQLMLKSKLKQTAIHNQKMRMLFEKMTDGALSQDIDFRTFKAFLGDENIKMWLNAMGYDTHDPDLIFFLLDTDRDGTLSVDDLIEGMSSLRGDAHSIDMKVLLRQIFGGRQDFDGRVGSVLRAQSSSSTRRDPEEAKERGTLLTAPRTTPPKMPSSVGSPKSDAN